MYIFIYLKDILGGIFLNELFVLSQLMESLKSSYILRKVIQGYLGTNRTIRFGILYPLLNKLESAGLITINQRDDSRNQKISAITKKGKDRFF